MKLLKQFKQRLSISKYYGLDIIKEEQIKLRSLLMDANKTINKVKEAVSILEDTDWNEVEQNLIQPQHDSSTTERSQPLFKIHLNNQLENDNTVILRFYKSVRGLWYVDIPEWGGSIDALEMVRGADEMLEDLSEYKGNDVYVQFATSKFEGSKRLVKIQEDIADGGAYYGYPTDMKPKIIWLCSVSDWYFGYHPIEIFYKNITL